MLKKFIKIAYRKLPLSHSKKMAIKNFLFKNLGTFFKGFNSYSLWYAYKNNNYINVNSKIHYVDSTKDNWKTKKTESIAIHVHLFYVDLLEEIYAYLQNMPFQFDLFVSITNKQNIPLIENRLNKIYKLNKLTIKEVLNRGKDVAPFVVTFAKELLQYTYICHIHTKKSLRTGIEQNAWRNHLFNNLLELENIKKVFTIFNSNKKIGFIYPETFIEMPYWAHTWLKAEIVSKNLLIKLNQNIPKNKYIDFSVGTMFWAKSQALEKLLSYNFTYDDFPDEEGQTDGNLAYAVERSLPIFVQNQNFSFAVTTLKSNTYTIDYGNKNLWQYHAKNYLEFLNFVRNYDIISFDIFDTLLSRLTCTPECIFNVLAIKVLNKFAIKDFITIRLNAQNSCHNKLNREYSIDDIYNEIAEQIGVEKAIIIKNMEIAEEINLSEPRYEVVKILQELKKLNKKVILVSDMYLTKDIIKKILAKNNIHEYDEIYVSSEENLRKSDSKIWLMLKEKYKALVHIGDNEVSDTQNVVELGLHAYHIFSKEILIELSAVNILQKYLNTLGDKIILGLISSKLYNDPFRLNSDRGELIVRDPYEYSYIAIAPVIFYFLIWLVKKVAQDGIENILFLSREGYILNKMYNLVSKNTKKSYYFLASRRAASIASIKNIEDIQQIFKYSFEGNLENLMKVRFDINVTNSSLVSMPQDFNKYEAFITKYYNEILAKAEIERNNYEEYIESLGIDLTKKTIVVDLGYSGSIQYYLSKMLDMQIDGYYFTVNETKQGSKVNNNKMQSCYRAMDNSIAKFSLVLEAVLVAKEGQLINFNSLGEPNYKTTGNTNFEKIALIHQAIKDFVSFATIKYEFISELDYTQELVLNLFEMFIINTKMLDIAIKNLFVVEDEYVANNHSLNAFKQYEKTFLL